MTPPRRFLKNWLTLSLAELAARPLRLWIAVYLARALGPEGFGRLGFVQAVVGYFALFASAGIPLWGTRRVAKAPGKLGRTANQVLPLRLGLAALSYLALVGFALLTLESPATRALVFIWGLSLFPLALYLDWAFQGMERMGYIGLASLIDPLLLGLLVWLWVRSAQDLPLAMVAYLLGATAKSGLMLGAYLKRWGPIRLRVNLRGWKAVLRRSLPLGLSSLLMAVYFNVSLVFLGYLKAEQDVGYYHAAFRITFFLTTFLNLLNQALFPVINRELDRAAGGDLARVATKYVLALGFPLALGGTLVASPLIVGLYGGAYQPAAWALSWLLWQIPLNLLTSLYANFLLALHRDRAMLLNVALGTLASLALNATLVPAFGHRGAAAATTLSELVVCGAMLWGGRAYLRPVFLYDALKVWLASAAMAGLVGSLEGMGLAFRVLSGGGAFLGGFWLLRGVQPREWALLKRAVRLRQPGGEGK